MTKVYSSESVCIGHPDKLCDQIADAILDAFLARDPDARVACEVAVGFHQKAGRGCVVLLGEITSKASVDLEAVARRTIREVGYDDPALGFDADGVEVVQWMNSQAPDIQRGVGEPGEKNPGAGDQGMMYGFACRETEVLMPAPLYYARRICQELRRARESRELDFLRPDGKAQVTIEYENGAPTRVSTVVCSAQHRPGVPIAEIRKGILERVLYRAIPETLRQGTQYLINPTGVFETGGPKGDSGLTGRKIIVDTYGGMAHHGGGSFSGKDPTKVDRSGAYAARHAAKNLVAAGLAERLEIRLAYAIGHREPLMIDVDSFGTGVLPDERIAEIAREVFDFRPGAIIERLKLRRPVYLRTAREGHFGVPDGDADYTWERLDVVDAIKKKYEKRIRRAGGDGTARAAGRAGARAR